MELLDDRVRAGNADLTGEIVPLTGFDQMAGHSYVRSAFVYRQTLDPALLADALSNTLKYFPVFAGRLISIEGGRHGIICNDAGVRWSVHDLLLTLPEVDLQFTVSERMGLLTHSSRSYAAIDKDVPLFAVKLNQLSGGGSILGLSFAHCLTDTAGFMTFMRAWSDAVAGVLTAHQNVCREPINKLSDEYGGEASSGFERYDIIGTVKALYIVFKQFQYKFTCSHQAFHISDEQVTAIKNHVEGERVENGQWVSTQDSLVASLWKMIVESKPSKGSTCLMNVINFRNRFDANMALPADYIGNAVLTRKTDLLNNGQFKEMSTYQVACLLREQYDTVNPENVGRDAAYLKKVCDNLGKKILLAYVFDIIEGGFIVNNWSRFDFYSIDLGVGKPLWYNPPPAFGLTNILHIIPAPDGSDGYDLHLQLPDKELQRFRGAFN